MYVGTLSDFQTFSTGSLYVVSDKPTRKKKKQPIGFMPPKDLPKK